MQGQPGLEIRIRDHSRIFFNATNSMAVLELANELLLKITFFEVSTIVSVYLKFQYLDIQGFVLETEHTPELVLTSKI